MRACIVAGCAGTTLRGSRCAPHQQQWNQQRNQARGSYYTGHGYRGRRAQVIAAQPWCALCGATTDLTADHLTPGDPDSALRVLCRSCNSGLRRGGHEPDAKRTRRATQALRALHI